MSLATRCPACGTIFRVVQDQLKVSEGWVRCGQCHEVFHGIESLFDLESDPALTARRAARQAAPSAAAVAAAQQARSERAAFATAPTQPVPLAPAATAVPAAPTAPTAAAAPAASAASTTPARAPTPGPVAPSLPSARAPAQAPAAPQGTTSPSTASAAEGDAGRASGFAPLPAPAVPRGMAPRFAARWAEAARAQSERQAPAAWTPIESKPTFAGAPAPTPTGLHSNARAAAAPMPASTTPDVEPPPPSFEAPTEPMGLDPADREHVDIALFDEGLAAPGAHAAFAPSDARATEEGAALHAPEDNDLSAAAQALPPLDAELAGEEAAAASRAAEFAAPQEPQAPGPDVPVARDRAAPQAGGAAPARGEDAAEEGEEAEDAGPPTLASMLPEPVAEWPPRSRRGSRRGPARAAASPSADAAAVLESERERERSHPRFVREARRGERWNRPWVRASLGAALGLLVVAALAQAAWPWRDTLASRWPTAAPLFEMACEQLECRIEAPRSIASLTLDGSSLTRTDVDHVLLFSADLHNRSDHAVRMPSFDLSFMDLNGQVVARKVLDPTQIGIRQNALGPEAELHVHARIQVAGLEASGFQAEMFYP
jgi:predicted Zn finger-like uncharacterized protein